MMGKTPIHVKLQQMDAAAVGALRREEDREGECLARHRGHCLLVNHELGWQHRMELAKCDECWRCGPNSRKGRGWRRRYARGAVRDAMANLDGVRRDVIVALLARWGKHKEIARSGADIGYAVRRDMEWRKVRLSWDTATSLVMAVAGRLAVGKVDPAVKEVRRGSCLGEKDEQGDWVAGREPCPSLRWFDGKPYCGACGCGASPVAALESEDGAYDKLDYPWLRCPRKRPGFMGSGPDPGDRGGGLASG